MTAPQADEALTDLAFLALDHGIESIKDGSGPLIPFTITEPPPGGRNLQRHVSDTLEEAQTGAREALRRDTDAVRAALAYDGYITVDGERSDAIIVEAYERGQEHGVIYAQRYQPARLLRKFSTIGNTAFLGDAEPLF